MTPPDYYPYDASPSDRFSKVGRYLDKRPYLSALVVLFLFLSTAYMLSIPVGALIKSWHFTTLARQTLGEGLSAIVVLLLIILFSSWSETGFRQGVTAKGLLVCLVPVGLLLLIFGTALPSTLSKASASIIVLAVVTVILVGFTEEGLFRGLLLRILLPKGIWPAIIVSSLLFGCIHLTNVLSGFSITYILGQIIGAFGLGVLFSAVRLRTGSIWPSLLMHAFYDINGIILITTDPKRVQGINLSTSLAVNSVLALIFLIIALVLLRPGQLSKLRLAYGLIPHEQITEVEQAQS